MKFLKIKQSLITLITIIFVAAAITPLSGCGGGGGDEGGSGGGDNPDTILPVVSITTPASGATVNGTSVLVSVNATDASGIADVSLKVDGNIYSNTPTGSGPYAFGWNTTSLTNGNHTLQACAHDKSRAYNQGCSEIRTVNVSNAVSDTTPPTVSVMFPAAGGTVSGTVTLAASASDTQSGVANVQFKLDGTVLGPTLTISPYTHSWDSKTATNGSHTLVAEAKDNAGNSATSVSVTFTVSNTGSDTVPPSIDFFSPLEGATIYNTILLMAFVTDSGSGVDYMEYYLGSNLLGRGAVGSVGTSYQLSFNTKNYADGAYTLKVRACDKAGNCTETTPKSVTIKNTFVLSTPVLTAYADTSFIGGCKIIYSWSYDLNDVTTYHEVVINGATQPQEGGWTAGYPTTGKTVTMYWYPSVATDVYSKRVWNCERLNPTNCSAKSNWFKVVLVRDVCTVQYQ